MIDFSVCVHLTPEEFATVYPSAKLHHTAKHPMYCSVNDSSPYYRYSGRFGTGFVRLRPLPLPERLVCPCLCLVEYWIIEKKGKKN